MTTIGLLALIGLLLALRQPLFVLLGAATCYVYLFFGDGVLGNVVEDIWNSVEQEMLLSIPLFMLAGTIMTRGSIARRLIRIMSELTAPVPGGLAVATVFSCAAFAAISGSSTVTLLAIGSVMYPALVERGYSKRFALGTVCAAGTLGIIVPPSIPLILYGVMTQTSITELFIAGIGPALLLTALMAGQALWRNRHLRGRPWQGRAIVTACRDGIFAVAMPVLILGGIYSGYFTATESAAVAVVYALVVEVLIHREIKLAGIYTVLLETARLIGALIAVLVFALSLNVFMSYERIPQELVELMAGMVDSKIAFLLAVTALLLMLGCVMEITPAILILAPLLTPIAVSYGVDPVHFGIVMIVNLELGYLTPPMGLNLIVAMSAFREPYSEIARAALPMLAIMLIGLLITTFVPELSLFLVR